MTEHFIAGAAAQPIAFANGLPLAGYIRRTGGATGQLAPLDARVVYLAHGASALALVALDLLYVPRAVADRAAQVAAEALDLSPRHVQVAATHTHSGPAIADARGAAAEAVSDAVRTASRAAQDRAQPVELLRGRLPVGPLAANRRHGTPPADPGARVLVARSVAQPDSVQAVLFEAPCHPTVLEHDNRQYSPDWPGAARGVLEQALGGTAVFIQGCSGDLNPLFTGHEPTDAAFLGQGLGYALASGVIDALRAASARYVNLSWNRAPSVHLASPLSVARPGPISHFISRVGWPWAATPQPGEAAAALAQARTQWQALPEGAERDQAGAALALAWARDLRAGGKLSRDLVEPEVGPRIGLEVRTCSIGPDLDLVTFPGEVFEQTGMELRAAWPRGTEALIASCANQSVGYLPPAAEYDALGYEVGASYLAPGAAEALRDAALTHRCTVDRGGNRTGES
ncbi:MAG: hypothetical protein LBE08_04060 [Bifidobacteriaceae bacterium]|jgi:hypothetical protein|nr:hypothetical protein [Bifidobacteriaceae bacterium]